MRKAALLCVFCLPILGLAQTTTGSQERPAAQEPQQQQQQPQQETQTYESSIPAPTPPPKNPSASEIMYPGITPDMLKAPQPGQPLEARDLLILTGKDKPQGTYPSIYGWGLMGGYSGGYYGRGRSRGGILGGSGLLNDRRGMDAELMDTPFLFSSANGQFFVMNPRRLKNVSVFGPVVSPFLPVNPIFPAGAFTAPHPTHPGRNLVPKPAGPSQTTAPNSHKP